MNSIDEDGYASLLDEAGDQKEDLKIPENEKGKEMKKRVENEDPTLVTVLSACGEEHIFDWKVDTSA